MLDDGSPLNNKPENLEVTKQVVGLVKYGGGTGLIERLFTILLLTFIAQRNVTPRANGKRMCCIGL
jgi:hypothetical protein